MGVDARFTDQEHEVSNFIWDVFNFLARVI